MDYRSGSDIQTNEKINSEIAYVNRTKREGRISVYLAEAKEAISAVLMTERNGKQMPIYFVSRALQGPKINYTLMEKLILALVSASKRLKRPRTLVKGKILVDFIVERTKDDSSNTPMEDKEELLDPWILFTDGSSCINGSEARLILINPEGMKFTHALRFGFKATNNEVEYETLIAGLRIAEQMGIKNLQEHVDSRLVANQVNGSYIAKKPCMIKYLEKLHPLSKQVLVEELKEKSIDEKEVLALVEKEGHTWITPIYDYLTEEILPREKKKARAIRRKAGRYAVTNEVLYKKSFLGPWLRCVRPLLENYVLRELHDGSCNMHADLRFVMAKALRSGYYWPTMHADTEKLIRECSNCQWIEAKPVATITRAQIKKFVWDNIVCRFGLPWEIISDNEKQFRDNPFKDWCEKLLIRQCFASVKHPQANGLVERANRSLDKGIKASFGNELGPSGKKENKQQSKRQKAKPKWKNTIMPGFVTQASGHETLSTETMKKAMRKEERSNLNGKDPMKSRKL
nr:hypothetical protein [Tanacetum cinerariifolium]